jgi:hypothetical protein
LVDRTLCAAAGNVAALSTGTTRVSTGEFCADEQPDGIDERRVGEIYFTG